MALFQADIVDKETLELVEIEARELLTTYGFDGDNCPVIYGSALLALKDDPGEYGSPSVKSLLDTLDTYVPDPTRDYTSPFYMPIDNIFTAPGRGCVAVGTLKRGVVEKNMPVDLIGHNEKIVSSISDIHVSYRSIENFESK